MPVPRTVYFPFPLGLMAVFLLGLALLFTLVTIDLIGCVYQRIGLSPNQAFTLLLSSVPGSAINLPLVRLKGESSVQESNVGVYGMPTVIPTIVAIHMLVQFQIYLPALLCVAQVAAIVHRFARPIPGAGSRLHLAVPGGAGTGPGLRGRHVRWHLLHRHPGGGAGLRMSKPRSGPGLTCQGARGLRDG